MATDDEKKPGDNLNAFHRFEQLTKSLGGPERGSGGNQEPAEGRTPQAPEEGIGRVVRDRLAAKSKEPEDDDGYCMFCGQPIAEVDPIMYGELSFDANGEYQLWDFATHPLCLMRAAHQSLRDEGWFDAETGLLTNPERDQPGESSLSIP